MEDWIAIGISLASFGVSGWALRYARTQAAAARIQAQAACEQVQAAEKQVLQAYEAARESNRSGLANEIAVLDAARTRIDANAPNLIIGIETIKGPHWISYQIFLKDADRASKSITPPTDIKDGGIQGLDNLEFLVRGVIRNDSPSSIQVRPEGMRLAEGESKLHPEHIDLPMALNLGRAPYLLLPGQVALFEWQAGTSIKEWCELYESYANDRPSTNSHPTARFRCCLGDRTNEWTIIDIELDAYPLRRDSDSSPWRLDPDEIPHVRVRSPKRVYPKTLRWLKRELKDHLVVDDLKDWWDRE
ncbi:hypothetical protein ACFFV7_03940 [Nonomuraea spiralis]|uniref:Uncharacterized protein n=1 Tax=Nonomuraea spiralis TaxID=46182 RepID=A0ABV5I8G7_9ACTN|nr:hypothetical protein [Nonomuraea spiralis]GGT10936.1 hypothetical protein GCM10010176_064580 [Nonomuraea spiralis]